MQSIRRAVFPTLFPANRCGTSRRLHDDVDDGRYFLPGAPTGTRETIISSAFEGMPQYLALLPGPGWSPVLAAVFTAAFFLLLTVKFITLSFICGALAVVMILIWMWASDPEPTDHVDIGGGIRLATYASGSMAHSWWAMVIIMLVAGSLYLSFLFSYLYLWTVSPQVWPRTLTALPGSAWPMTTGTLLLLSGIGTAVAARLLPSQGKISAGLLAAVVMSTFALLLGLGLEGVGQWKSGLRPAGDSHGAMVYLNLFLQLQLAAAVLVMAGFVIARHVCGRLHAVRRVSFDNFALLQLYTIGQGLVGILLIHGFPRLLVEQP